MLIITQAELVHGLDPRVSKATTEHKTTVQREEAYRNARCTQKKVKNGISESTRCQCKYTTSLSSDRRPHGVSSRRSHITQLQCRVPNTKLSINHQLPKFLTTQLLMLTLVLNLGPRYVPFMRSNPYYLKGPITALNHVSMATTSRTLTFKDVTYEDVHCCEISLRKP